MRFIDEHRDRFAVALLLRVTVDAVTATGSSDLTMNTAWGLNTADNVNRTATRFAVSSPGVHTLTFWLVGPTVVVQKLVADAGGLESSYLGPPESLRSALR
jgi:Mn2+/Fe2+ NRAMP family transporter